MSMQLQPSGVSSPSTRLDSTTTPTSANKQGVIEQTSVTLASGHQVTLPAVPTGPLVLDPRPTNIKSFVSSSSSFANGSIKQETTAPDIGTQPRTIKELTPQTTDISERQDTADLSVLHQPAEVLLQQSNASFYPPLPHITRNTERAAWATTLRQLNKSAVIVVEGVPVEETRAEVNNSMTNAEPQATTHFPAHIRVSSEVPLYPSERYADSLQGDGFLPTLLRACCILDTNPEIHQFAQQQLDKQIETLREMERLAQQSEKKFFQRAANSLSCITPASSPEQIGFRVMQSFLSALTPRLVKVTQSINDINPTNFHALLDDTYHKSAVDLERSRLCEIVSELTKSLSTTEEHLTSLINDIDSPSSNINRSNVSSRKYGNPEARYSGPHAKSLNVLEGIVSILDRITSNVEQGGQDIGEDNGNYHDPRNQLSKLRDRMKEFENLNSSCFIN